MNSKIRKILAGVFFTLTTLLFLDFTGSIHAWFGWMAKIQFLPAVLALNVVVVIALVLLTLLMGRIYCSVICPLGVLQDIFGWFGKKAKKNTKSDDVSVASEPKTVYAPMNGNVIARENIPDATFAQGVLGDGVGIEPTEGVVYAPFDGEISTVAETKHAVGISGNNDMEMLIHVGIDTVKMNGEGFNVLVAEDDQVKAGQKIMTFSLDKIKAAGYSTTTAVLLTNSDDYADFKVVKTGAAKAGEKIITV